MSLVLKNILKVDESLQNLVREWRNSDEIRRYMCNENIISEKQHSEWIKSLKNSDRKEVYIVFYDESPIGVVSIDDIDFNNKKCEWGFYIYETSLRGRGIGQRFLVSVIDYVFNELGMEKLNGNVLEVNPNVIEMHKKLGFQMEGIRRKNILKNGKRIDVYNLGMLKEEWLSRRLEINIQNEDLAILNYFELSLFSNFRIKLVGF